MFFEEWDEPIISGIRWVEELIEIAGGAPIFPELADAGLARDRIVAPSEVPGAIPKSIFASWCGKKVKKAVIRAPVGVGSGGAPSRQNRIFEVKSTYILQPGPACLTEGVRQLHALLAQVHEIEVPSEVAPAGGSTRSPRGTSETAPMTIRPAS